MLTGLPHLSQPNQMHPKETHPTKSKIITYVKG